VLPRLRSGTVNVGGVSLDNHLILAAGILGTTGSSLARMLEHGAGGVVTKSIGPYPCEGHPGPCVVEVEGGVLNAMGLPNPSRDFADELIPLEGKPVIASIYGGRVPDRCRVVYGTDCSVRAEPELPPRRGLRRLARNRSLPGRGVYPGGQRFRYPGLGQADPQCHGYRCLRPGCRAGGRIRHCCHQHGEGNADIP
jgi:hypothetical protein